MMTGKRYDNARMKSFFAALKKEKRYRIDTTKLKMQEVKKIVWRFVVYYNRRRITTMNPNGIRLQYTDKCLKQPY